MRYSQSMEDKDAARSHLLHIRPYLICLSAIYEKPSRSVALSSSGIVLASDVGCTAGIWRLLLWGELQNEKAPFLQQTPLQMLT